MATDTRHGDAWLSPEIEDLFRAILSLKDSAELSDFMRDLCTLPELETMAHRWQVAQLVAEGLPYLEIVERTGASTTTVTRVAHWLRHGQDGYQVALTRRSSASRSR